MRLRELHLMRFGHFTDRRFSFSASDGRPDFHIIYGLNEAGKTTMMEAVLRLFFWLPESRTLRLQTSTREPVHFGHPRG